MVATGEARTTDSGAVLGVIAALVALIGSFLPWMTVEALGISESVSGTQDGKDGVYTAIGAGILIVLFALAISKRARGLRIAALVVAILMTALTIYDVLDINNVGGELGILGGAVKVGFGLWMTLIGSAVAVVAAIMSMRANKDASATTPVGAPPPAPGGSVPPAPPANPPSPIDPGGTTGGGPTSPV